MADCCRAEGQLATHDDGQSYLASNGVEWRRGSGVDFDGSVAPVESMGVDSMASMGPVDWLR